MKAWIIDSWSYLRSSYWFIPLVMAIAAIFLSISSIALDYWLMQHQDKYFEWLLTIHPDGARAILATIAGSMITVAGVTFSMTVVVVSFSIGQIGPRLIQNFMRDQANQFTLGIFIATFLYSILVLLVVVSSNGLGVSTFVPHVSILIALILTMLSIGFFIFFIHHVPESINIFKLLAKISEEYQALLDSLFPEKMNLQDKKIGAGTASLNVFKDPQSVISKKIGYIHYVDKDVLLKLAVEMDCIIEIKYQPGNFVTTKTSLIEVNKALNEKQQDKCLACFTIGRNKNQDRDLLFLSDEIVEIIARALSPGVNAPFIAIAAMDWLQVMIEALSEREIPDAYHYDEDHRLRIIASNITVEYFINNVFGKIRSYVSRDRNALLYVFHIIKMMLLDSKNARLNYSLKLHAEKFFTAANENLTSNEDKNDARESMAEIATISGKLL